jgi:hypothetical protein
MPKALRKASRLHPNKEVSVMAWIEDAAIVLRKGILLKPAWGAHTSDKLQKPRSAKMMSPAWK